MPRAPSPLVAVALGIAASGLLGLKARGVDTVGAIPSGLPALTPPDVDLLAALWPAALGIALMSFTESIAAGRAFAQPGEPTARREPGAARAGSRQRARRPLRRDAAGGGTSQTAVNARAGAQTPRRVAGHRGGDRGVVLFLAPLIGLMPQATLAAVVIVDVDRLIDPADFARSAACGRSSSAGPWRRCSA